MPDPVNVPPYAAQGCCVGPHFGFGGGLAKRDSRSQGSSKGDGGGRCRSTGQGNTAGFGGGRRPQAEGCRPL